MSKLIIFIDGGRICGEASTRFFRYRQSVLELITGDYKGPSLNRIYSSTEKTHKNIPYHLESLRRQEFEKLKFPLDDYKNY